MIQIHIALTEDQIECLQRLSMKQNVSVDELVRRGADSLLTQQTTLSKQEHKRRAVSVIGKYSSKNHDISERHDDYLAEAYSA